MIQFYKFIFERISLKYKLVFFIETIVLLILNITQIIIPILQKNAIDNMINNNAFNNELIFMVIISLIGISLSFLNIFFQCSIIYHLERKLQLEMIISSYTQENRIIETRGTGAYLVAIFGDTEHLAQILNNNIFEAIAQIIASIVILIYSLQWSELFVYIIFISYFLLIIVNIFSSKYFGKMFSSGREKVMEINPIILEQIENRTSILGYGDVNSLIQNVLEKFRIRDKFFRKANVADGISGLFSSTIRVLSMLIFFVTSMYQILEGKMMISSFIALLTCFSYIFLPVNSIKNCFMSIEKFQLIKDKIEPGLLIEPKRSIPKNESLLLDNCSYQYGENKNIVSNLSLNINKKIGIVGLSGEGKSTIVKLLLGEKLPTAGKCILGEIDTNQINKNIIYSLIRYYKQDSELFDEDLEYNITLGKKGISSDTYSEIVYNTYNSIKKAISLRDEKNKYSNLHEIVNTLFLVGGKDFYKSIDLEQSIKYIEQCSNEQIMILAEVITAKKYYSLEKYESLIKELKLQKIVGRKLGQHGNKVSGGEKNRIMLARFLLPEFGKIFIIDEPFTSLDVINEKDCFEVLKKYTTDMNGIIISHKINIIQEFCDEIIIIEDGSVSAIGTHKELISNSELYSSLCANSNNTLQE